MSQIIDAATRALQQQAAATVKANLQLSNTLEAQLAEIQSNQNTLADQADQIAENEKQIETAVRSAAAEIRLQVKEDRKQVLAQLLVDEGLVATTEAEINAGQQALQEALTRANRTEFDAVTAAEAALHAKYNAEITHLKSEYAVALATFKADASADESKIAMLEDQVEQLRNDIKAERDARITIAEHESKAAGVTINQGK